MSRLCRTMLPCAHAVRQASRRRELGIGGSAAGGKASECSASADAPDTTLAHFLFGRFLLRLQPLHENLRCARDVIAAELLRTYTFAGDDSIEDLDMLTQNSLRHLRVITQHLAHDTAKIRPVRRGGLADQRVC